MVTVVTGVTPCGCRFVTIVTIDDVDNEALPTRWFDDATDKRMYESGNCFQTREQAEAALEKIKAVLMEVHDDNN